jgi:UDP-glucose:(heptosyl)LPS alpha-1,3-glucosyltransferase
VAALHASPRAAAPQVRRRIVQCARTIGAGFGVSGPAYELERAFTALGCECERFTLETIGLASGAEGARTPSLGLMRFWRDVVLFSLVGSAVLWWRFGWRPRPPRTTVLCHVDALYGDVFVVRSLHKAFVERHPSRRWMLLRNPLHALVLARDSIRFRWGVHDRIVALSERNKADVVRLYGVPPARIAVIPNGVDLERFRPSAAARAEVRQALSIPDDSLAVIFVGHEFARKGLKVVLEALRRCRGTSERLFAIVAGTDSTAALEREFADMAVDIRFVGHRLDIERYYAAADVFVLPASFDISPLVGLEALASGLPILMTDVGGVGEYLQDGGNGWFIRADPEDLAEKLVRLDRDRETLRAMSRAARESVADRGWHTIARRFLELMDRLEPGIHRH